MISLQCLGSGIKRDFVRNTWPGFLEGGDSVWLPPKTGQGIQRVGESVEPETSDGCAVSKVGPRRFGAPE
jgi:hypothetical protein